jgi:S-DNA-T family DNA segregation ATPase FtsK/SpoIIIE
MTQDSNNQYKPARKPGDKPEQINWLDQIGNIWLRFRHYGSEFLGVSALAFSLLTFLALFNIAQGSVISPWGMILRNLFGWGSLLIAVLVLFLGLAIIRSAHKNQPRIRLGRILILELDFFVFLALLTYFGDVSIERARQGLDGGLVGWGISSLLASVLSNIGGAILIIFCLLASIYYFMGLNKFIGGWIERWVSSEAGADSEVLGNLGDQKAKKTTSSTASPMLRSNRLPPLNLLMNDNANRPDEEHIRATAEQIEVTLAEFGIPARVVGYRVGPTVTQFAIEPGYIEKPGPEGHLIKQKVRVAHISTLSRDLALALSAERIRIEAPVPGRSFVGIEVPNLHISTVRLRSILESDAFQRNPEPLLIALGRDVSGQPVVADLARMPHLLIAGTTGSGKSVCIAALTTCLVLNNLPEDLKLAMLDPKMVELVRFNGLPHLLGKVETEIERMLAVLRWAIEEMDRRYKILEQEHARDLETYNRKMERRGQPRIPRVVVLVDELADLMMSAPDQTEHALIRLAQMARATGIHLVVATQRPSTDVVTGLIKANFPARISFTVASSVDSRVILDTNGAETLLGRGDMLFLNPELGSPVRAQGVMVTDQEIERINGYWQKVAPAESATTNPPWESILQDEDNENDSLVEQAAAIVRASQRASASMLQRKLRIGYPRAARLLDELEELGVVGPSLGGGREREVLLSAEDEENLDGLSQGDL